VTTLGLRGPSLLLSPLCARTRTRDAYNGRLGPLRPGWLKKVAWAGQKPTPQKRSRRRMWTRWPAEVLPNVATQRLVRSTLCPIRLTFSEEKRGWGTPIILRKISGHTAGHSPLAHFATPGNFAAKTDVDRRGAGTWTP